MKTMKIGVVYTIDVPENSKLTAERINEHWTIGRDPKDIDTMFTTEVDGEVIVVRGCVGMEVPQ